MYRSRDYYLKQNQEYIKQLGLDSLFNMKDSYTFHTPMLTLTTEGGGGDAIRGELQIIRKEGGGGGEVILAMSHLGEFDWTAIEGSLVERRVKVLNYLIGIGYVPAIALLRSHKIDSLI